MSIQRYVRETGFAVQGVGCNTPFNYTVGFQLTLCHPELVISSLSLAVAGEWFWHAFYAIQKAKFRFQPGQTLYNFMCDRPVFAIAVDREHFQGHLSQVRFFFEDIPNWNQPHEAIQLVLSDKNGHFPWERAYAPDFEQLLLGTFTGSGQAVDLHPVLKEAEWIAVKEQGK